MTFEAYQEWNPIPRTAELLAEVQTVIKEFTDAGYTLTLRQVYYQLVGKAKIENNFRSYKNLGNLIVKARMAGVISWTHMEDRNRAVNEHWLCDDDQLIVNMLPHQILFDRWAEQETYVEVWVEKEALGNVIERACEPFYVSHLACKGYLSSSEAWRAGKRFEKKSAEGKNCMIIHLGDHDPSGMGMTEDNQNRMDVFNRRGHVSVKRIALNMDQIEKYEPPPNYAKETDSRFARYEELYGDECWELDALRPDVIVDMIGAEITKLIDPDLWHSVGVEEDDMKRQLKLVGQNWDHIKDDVLPNL